ncbi:MAG: hypothetical protein HRU14_11170 [Planctomycetes bacterium]|nr:hypothetical protein [Planctomycetota bacterium]
MRGSTLSSRRTDARGLLITSLVVAAGLAWGACGGTPDFAAAAPVPGALAGPLIVLTGNEKGFIRPCGCSKPALGGVHRRATWLEKLRKEEPGLHLVSVGNLLVHGGQQQRMKFETFMMSMDLMGYQALAPGPGEFSLGVDYLLEMRSFASFPFVGNNVFKDGERVFKESVRLGDGPYIVTGLVPPLPGVAGVVVKDPVTSLKEWLRTLEVERDRPIVLFNGDRKAAVTLASAVPAVWRDRVIIVFGGAFDGPFELTDTAVPVLSVGSKGRFLAYLRPEARTRLSHFRLEEEIAGQEDVTMMLEGYRQSLADEKLVEKYPRRPLENGYLGDASCVECHEDSCKLLDPTPHERAWASIKATNDHHDPECASCHVTGWGDSTGFITEAKTPKLINVTCEACHGAGEEHVNVQTKTPNGKLGKGFCIRCHDPDNSPQFDFAKYWPKIAHPPEGK